MLPSPGTATSLQLATRCSIKFEVFLQQGLSLPAIVLHITVQVQHAESGS